MSECFGQKKRISEFVSDSLFQGVHQCCVLKSCHGAIMNSAHALSLNRKNPAFAYCLCDWLKLRDLSFLEAKQATLPDDRSCLLRQHLLPTRCSGLDSFQDISGKNFHD